MPPSLRLLFPCALFCLLAAACVPSLPPGSPGREDARSPAGDWRDENGNHFSLDPDGVLALPGQSARSGLTWSRTGETLTLSTLDMPGGAPLEDRLEILRLGRARLELRSPGGEPAVWRRAGKTVQRLSGTLRLPEGAVLPSLATIGVRLFPAGGGAPVASSLARASGRNDLPFRVHYLAAGAPEEGGAALLDAAVFYANEKLFATEAPVPVDLSSSPRILLRRPQPGEADLPALPAPSCFTGNKTVPGGEIRLTLCLEPDGFYLLRRTGGDSPENGDSVSMGPWRQIDRNHILELGRGSEPPLRATLRPAKSLLLADGDLPGREMELKPVELSFSVASFPVTGLFSREEGRAVLRECTSGLDFAVRAPEEVYSALARACREEPGPCRVECEAAIRLPQGVPSPAGNDADGRSMEIRRLLSAQPGKTCAEPYASVPLERTYWRLIKLDGEPARAFPGQAEPHLILRPQEPAVGSDGCNNFFLPWTRSGTELRFKPGGSTLMLCAQGNEQAGAMLDMLLNAEEWNISGAVLELKTTGRAAAVFEAVDIGPES